MNFVLSGKFYNIGGKKVDPDQTALQSSLIRIYTFCSGITVQIFKLNMVFRILLIQEIGLIIKQKSINCYDSSLLRLTA